MFPSDHEQQFLLVSHNLFFCGILEHIFLFLHLHFFHRKRTWCARLRWSRPKAARSGLCVVTEWKCWHGHILCRADITSVCCLETLSGVKPHSYRSYSQHFSRRETVAYFCCSHCFTMSKSIYSIIPNEIVHLNQFPIKLINKWTNSFPRL